jgi:hypothetical protein
MRQVKQSSNGFISLPPAANLRNIPQAFFRITGEIEQAKNIFDTNLTQDRIFYWRKGRRIFPKLAAAPGTL